MPSTMSQAVMIHNNTQAQIRRRERMMKERNRVISHSDAAWYELKDTQWNIVLPKEIRPSTQPLCNVCLPNFGGKGKEIDFSMYPIVDVTKTARIFFAGVFSSLLESLNLQNSLLSIPRNLDERLILRDESVFNAFQNGGKPNKSAVLCLLKHFKNGFNHLKFRLFYWLFVLFLKTEFRAICVSQGQIILLKEASKKNNLVYFPLHRSSLDLPILSLTLAKNNIRLPIGAIEDSVVSPALREVVKCVGCITSEKWKTETDSLYQAVFNSYLSHCWGSGSDAIVFPEGRISNSGKPHVGRGNLLYFYSKCYQDKTIQDAQAIPVSVSYDKILDDYLHGKSIWTLLFRLILKTIFNRSHGGFVRVDFGRPFSFHHLMTKMEKASTSDKDMHMSVSSIVFNQDETEIERDSYTVHSLTRHLLYDCSRLSSVMATQAVAFLLLFKDNRQTGMTMTELTSSLDSLREDLKARSVDTGFTGASAAVVSFALDVMGPNLVEKKKRSEDTFLIPSASLPNLLQLSRLANGVIVHFSLEGIIGRVLASTISEGTLTNVKIIDLAHELRDILQFEFVFTPTCAPLSDSIYQTFDDFVTSGVLLPCNVGGQLRRKYTAVSDEDLQLSDDNEPDVQSVPYTIHSEHPKLKFFSGLVKPILDTYACTVSYLNTLDDREGLIEEELVRRVLSCARSLLEKGLISRAESVSEEVVINCLRLLVKWQVLDVVLDTREKHYIFRSAYKESESLGFIFQRISKFT